MQNIYLKEEINKKDFQIIYAKNGEFKLIGKRPILVLYEGARISSKNKNITNISFSKSDFSLSNVETNTTTYKKTQEINSFKLIECIFTFYNYKLEDFEKKVSSIENCSYKNIHNIFKEAYKRFITPFYIPVLSLISLFLLMLSKENSNYSKARFFTFTFGFLVIIFSEITIRLITKNTFQNIFLFFTPIVILISLYLFIFKKFNKK